MRNDANKEMEIVERKKKKDLEYEKKVQDDK
jgi:hypothetical protein